MLVIIDHLTATVMLSMDRSRDLNSRFDFRDQIASVLCEGLQDCAAGQDVPTDSEECGNIVFLVWRLSLRCSSVVSRKITEGVC